MSRRFVTPLLLLIAALSLGSGCKWIKMKLNMGWTVENPEEETPEWVIQRVLEASSKEPFDDAWGEYSQYLHSDEANSPVSMKEWETLRFPALRRKHDCYLRATEADSFAYEIKEEIPKREDYVEYRVSCKTTDMPTPCHLVQDPEVGGKWRVKYNCLN